MNGCLYYLVICSDMLQRAGGWYDKRLITPLPHYSNHLPCLRRHCLTLHLSFSANVLLFVYFPSKLLISFIRDTPLISSISRPPVNTLSALVDCCGDVRLPKTTTFIVYFEPHTMLLYRLLFVLLLHILQRSIYLTVSVSQSLLLFRDYC